VRVELADHVADDPGALLEAAAGVEPELEHRVEDAALHGLEAVAHVGQRAGGDGREGVGQVALGERLAEVDDLELLRLARGRRR
jgi:hypothetical protein